MTAVDHVDRLIEQYQLALDEFMKGNPEPVQELFSHTEEASLANPYGPPVRGWDKVAKTTEHAASLRRDGRATSFEIVAKYVTSELAYVVQIEHLESEVGESEDITPYALRATRYWWRVSLRSCVSPANRRKKSGPEGTRTPGLRHARAA